MNSVITRFRIASFTGSLGAAAGVFLFGESNLRIVVFSALGFLIGGVIGLLITTGQTMDHERLTIPRSNARFMIVVGWLSVLLGITALIVSGWNLKIAVITFGFLIIALFVSFYKLRLFGR